MVLQIYVLQNKLQIYFRFFLLCGSDFKIKIYRNLQAFCNIGV